MLTVAEASRTVLSRVPRLGTEFVSLASARGRVLGTDIVATRPLPGFDNSAMDGYAARSNELPATLPVLGVVGAGEVWPTPVPPRSALRIFTGAPVPNDLDTVVMQEDATIVGPGAAFIPGPDYPDLREGDRVGLPAAQIGEHIRRAGEDIAVGEVAIAAGTRLSAWHLGVLAALGVAQVPVVRAPRVALIATGDELVDVATVPSPGQLVDSSAHALAALVAEAGGVATHLGIARDDLAVVTERIAAALDFDVVITTGGVSVGDRDHVHAAFANAGVTLELWKVAMKPGKPFSFGTRGQTSVFGLPGNPVSTVVGFELFVRPALLAMQRARAIERPRAPVRLAGGYRKPAGRAHYLRAVVTRSGIDLVANPHTKQGSAMLSSLVGTNALVELAAELTVVEPDGIVPAILLESV